MTNLAFVETDPDRLKRRADVRLQIARRELTRRRAEELREKIRKLDEAAEAAADRHRAIVDPLREELRKIEDQIAAAMAARKAVPPKLDARRLELIEQIDGATETLEREVRAIRERTKAPAAEAEDLEWRVVELSGLESSLTSDLADPELVQAAFVADRAFEWAGARHRAAVEKVNFHEAHAQEAEERGDLEQAAIYRRRNNLRWEAEVRAAADALAAAETAAAEIHRRIIDE